MPSPLSLAVRLPGRKITVGARVVVSAPASPFDGRTGTVAALVTHGLYTVDGLGEGARPFRTDELRLALDK